MGALCLLPSTPRSCSGRGLASSPRPPRPAAALHLPPSASPSQRPQLAAAGGRRFAGVSRARGEKGGKNGGAEFFREDGVVDDMDGCQPWTILLTGTVAVACSWVLIHSAVITGGVSFVICAWWYIFLYSYPKAYTDMISERRKKVASGAEDTYGMEKM
ncbi:uncharacterized protein LOC119294753 isoform X2 [Triticum dicoccoides]|uniref:uncharacterized protein LOC119294753 isoform X2 n=1 Tax=Triticum dicoccoides TaxID=85692 RepID=UPI0018909A90|nr:uncharacterized protein LOC119294753 isoform X2 [Triticum dicoccoides]XP_044372283.1 uncharacterized protein LOC123094310 isoform X2 [Triticum aestivum]